MYRAIALAAKRECLAWRDEPAIAELAGRVALTFRGDRVLLGDEDVTEQIRTPEVTDNTRHVANNPLVRRSWWRCSVVWPRASTW